MIPQPTSHQIREWQEEVAQDPGAPAFLPLAEAYRRDGKLEVAKRLCLRGLERNPEHVDAHYLLGRVYRELGDAEKAHDEWDITLRLEPEFTSARRALGYLCVERMDWPGAIRHLSVVAAGDPEDRTLVATLAAARDRDSRVVEPPAEVDRYEVISSLLAEPIERFAREARVRFTVLIDPAGRILSQFGYAGGLDLAGFASLSAGIQAASGRLAIMTGQQRFDQLYQGQGESQIFMGPVRSPIADLTLIAVFGSGATIGMVRVLFRDFTAEVAGIDEWPGREASAGPEALERELATGLRRALRSVERWGATFLRRSE